MELKEVYFDVKNIKAMVFQNMCCMEFEKTSCAHPSLFLSYQGPRVDQNSMLFLGHIVYSSCPGFPCLSALWYIFFYCTWKIFAHPFAWSTGRPALSNNISKKYHTVNY